jgi:vitamin B12 transporter
MVLRYLSATSILAFVAAQPVWAEEVPGSDTSITVVASGRPQPIDQAGQSISVVGLEEIQSLQGPDFTRVLVRLPGVSVNRAGGMGAQTSVFVRGANSEQLLVTIDGVRVEDVSAPSGGYDFSNLVSGGVGKVELLRGSNSVVWGANAIGGVIAITSREIDGAEGSVEGGSHASWDANGSVGVKREDYALSLDAGFTRTTGIATRASDVLPNGFRQWHGALRGRLKLAQGLNLVASGRYAKSRVGIDSYDDTLGYVNHGEQQTGEQASGRVGLDYAGQGFSLKGGVSQSSLRRGYDDPTVQAAEYSSYLGRATRVDAAGQVSLPLGLALDLGGDSEWSHARSYYNTPFYTAPDTRNDARLTSGYGLLSLHRGRLDLAGGVRVNDHSTFGTHWTFGANGSLRLVQDVRLRASYGEGFKAPTLYQLFDPSSGNRDLKAETSTSYDVALEKGDRNGRVHGAVTWFHRDTVNLIDYNLSTYSYYNVGRAKAEGVEVEAGVRPVEALELRAAYSFVKSTNATEGSANFGRALARRPRQMLSVSGDWTTPLAGLALGADMRLVGQSYDNAANTVRLGDYLVVGLRASVPVGRHAEVFGRIENLTGERYSVVSGYNALGRTAALGLRAKI